ncbi:GDSL-like Lipase/Acylhydrolase family protein [Burkholderia ambifaria AMMD]|uniref:Lipolytic enzyme, G-D-S-L family n=1 Tax=Burkholderia ambifaria (strain ATCC BAA-244 / DSM 16087 / CCUG 44356 / LMG 19182 / AMMD) TaxID=339670 RepID=Q0BJ63_BURCM|nr:SGNH/GDSL hydrolase family protein [Burkholderia ambifaria]ABI85810.1 lipolytic enzyme, G-D-S-L family [Burkholderia ambifaria AMMD]AJY20561.1 GDSL-like Lipase/Acylhydrolase family protein [Burkholderia ambifaria AMMD]MBR7934772.1 SGNH/GDSL hydrolase family protein [Burkholderia ambifaria]PEH66853.1 GDSL family lipase [Burkholderia ambifaria]QQC03831.1 SGNH/GDSL hydrolase family protein [Burkholderia ambifaria]
MSFRSSFVATVLGASMVLSPLVASAAPAGWVAAWATALQPIPDLAAPPPLYRAPDVAGRTVRQIVYPTASGHAARIRVSNAYGRAPLVIDAAGLARAGDGAALADGAGTAVRFGGKASVTLAPGQELESDPVTIDVTAGRPYAISLRMGANQRMTVWHRVSNQFNYVSAPGDHVNDPGAGAFRTRFTQYAWVTELAVEAGAARASVAAIGDSITDGLRSSLNRNRRWPDALALRLTAAGSNTLGVVNLGISGNRLLSDSACYGTSLASRFERDALSRAGVKAAIVLIGINDINFAAMPPRAGLDCDSPHMQVTAASLIDGYRRLIEAAHRQGVKVFGATLTPAALPAGREAIRLEVNRWIRSGGGFDGVVDFDAVLRDPARPSVLLRRYDSGDGIHPSDAGYTAMADAVPMEQLHAAAGGK